MKAKRGRCIYKWISTTAAAVAFAYLVLLYFPQPLFAYSAEYGNLNIHSREPLPPEMDKVVAGAQERLRRVPFYTADKSRQIYLTGGFKMYGLLSHKAYRSFANSLPFINNIIINKTDIAADRVFTDREKNNSRSLSGVIAHEVTHLFIRERYGAIAAAMMPAWKNEGYCEYIAQDTTIPFEEGLRLWRENPKDDTAYRYIKYQAMIQFLLEKEKVSVDDLFTNTFDETDIAAKTFANLPQSGIEN
jgi:hypothetical protein